MNAADLTAYVAEHENEYVQQYVEALLEERASLVSARDEIVRTGYTDDARAMLWKVGRIVLFVAITVMAYAAGRWSN